MRLRGLLIACAALPVFTLVACGDDPFRLDWESAPDTVLLYSLARPELNLPSAFNLNTRRTVQIEAPGATGAWDIAVDTEEGGLVLLTPNALGVESRAAITTITDRSFEEIRRAPADTAAYVDSVPVELGPVYVIQTDESVGGFGTRCVYYAKLEALDIDTELGTLLFRYDSNPVCNSRDLIPPED